MRIRRVHTPKEACRKEKLKQRKTNKNTEQLKKVKGSKSNKKGRLSTTPKQRIPKEEANQDSTDINETPVVKHSLIVLEDPDDDTNDQRPKKTTKRGKITQSLLKPLASKPDSKVELQKGLVLGKESPGESLESEVQGGMQRRTPRRAAATAKKYIEEVTVDDEDDEPKKPDKKQKKLITSKGMYAKPVFKLASR